jgi:undecaprenyl-diphosphatase
LNNKFYSHGLLKKQVLLLAFFYLCLSAFVSCNNLWLATTDTNIVLFFNEHRITRLDGIINFVSNLSTPALIIAIIGLYVTYYKSENKIYLKRANLLLVAFATSAILIAITKNLVMRARPFTANTNIEKLGSGGSFSFPSGHTADAFLLLFASQILFSESTKIKGVFLVWAIIIAYSRLYLGVHFITDILGAIILAKFCITIYFKPTI